MRAKQNIIPFDFSDPYLLELFDKKVSEYPQMLGLILPDDLPVSSADPKDSERRQRLGMAPKDMHRMIAGLTRRPIQPQSFDTEPGEGEIDYEAWFVFYHLTLMSGFLIDRQEIAQLTYRHISTIDREFDKIRSGPGEKTM